jgi:hypothetical protein
MIATFEVLLDENVARHRFQLHNAPSSTENLSFRIATVPATAGA